MMTLRQGEWWVFTGQHLWLNKTIKTTRRSINVANFHCCTRFSGGVRGEMETRLHLSSPTSSLASRSASEATTYSSSFLPVALMRTCLVFQNFFCMRAITELSSPSSARPPLSMSPANLWPAAQSVQFVAGKCFDLVILRLLNWHIPIHLWISAFFCSANKNTEIIFIGRRIKAWKESSNWWLLKMLLWYYLLVHTDRNGHTFLL